MSKESVDVRRMSGGFKNSFGSCFGILAALIVVAIFFVAIGQANAQGVVNYCIQPANAINLRQSYSLESPVAENVPAGTRLHVTYEGVNGNWLRISRNDTVVWMARWLSYSKVSCSTPDAGSANQATAHHTGAVDHGDGTFTLPAGCYESYRYEGRYFSFVSVTCKSSSKIVDPVPASWYGSGCYISSRWEYYSSYFGRWTTGTSYSC